MKAIQVNASRPYQVLLGTDLLPTLGRQIREVTGSGTAVIVSDTTVAPLYAQAAEESLISAGVRALRYVFPAGEQSKSPPVYLDLLNFLARNHITRADCLIALGGGVVGDLTGFAAATYLRGIPYIQVPTTLLAAVDSSVGGKTAIDLPAGKNLCGAFCQPSLVWCSVDTLDTLPAPVFRDGCAEVIKYAVLYDRDLFAYLEETGLDFCREKVIGRCVELKRDVVARDEFDRGERMKLNLGHTIGHAVEALSGFRVSHGQAVAIGMAVVARAAGCPDRDRIVSILRQFGLPAETDYTAQALFESALADKKRAGDTIHMIVPGAIGDCAVVAMDVQDIKPFIEAGL